MRRLHPRLGRAAVLLLLAPHAARAEGVKTPWVVLPAQCPAPPPGDPTLLRLSEAIASALQEVAGGEVRVVSRDVRDDRCPDEDGVCPRDIAGVVGAERVVGLVLARGYKTLRVRVYRERTGLEREGELECRWEGGAVGCDTAPLAELVGAADRAPPLDRARVEAEFAAFRPRLDRCRGAKAEEGDQAPAVALDDGWIAFRVRPDGKITDVRIDPRELEGTAAARCMARTTESFSSARFAGAKPVAFRFPITERPPQKPAQARPAKPKKKAAKGAARSKAKAAGAPEKD